MGRCSGAGGKGANNEAGKGHGKGSGENQTPQGKGRGFGSSTWGAGSGEMPGMMKNMIPPHVWKLVARYGLVPEKGETKEG